MNLFPQCIAYSNTYEVEGEWTTGPVDENAIADNKSIVDEGIDYNNSYELEEGEWVPDPEDENRVADRSATDEGIALDLHACLLHMYNHLKATIFIVLIRYLVSSTNWHVIFQSILYTIGDILHKNHYDAHSG